jgi:hypothetical protein
MLRPSITGWGSNKTLEFISGDWPTCWLCTHHHYFQYCRISPERPSSSSSTTYERPHHAGLLCFRSLVSFPTLGSLVLFIGSSGVRLGGSFFVLLYYLRKSSTYNVQGKVCSLNPLAIYFQSVQGVSALASVVRNLPLILSMSKFFHTTADPSSNSS